MIMFDHHFHYLTSGFFRIDMDCGFAFSALHADSEQKEDADQKINILTSQDILNNPKIPKSDSWPF